MGRKVGWMRGTHDWGRGRHWRAVELWKEKEGRRKGKEREREREKERGRERGEGKRGEREGEGREKGGRGE